MEEIDNNATACCFDCKTPYSDFICDLTIQDGLWRIISPTKDEGGLLCPMCMIKRIYELGLPSVNVVVDLSFLFQKSQKQN